MCAETLARILDERNELARRQQLGLQLELAAPRRATAARLAEGGGSGKLSLKCNCKLRFTIRRSFVVALLAVLVRSNSVVASRRSEEVA